MRLRNIWIAFWLISFQLSICSAVFAAMNENEGLARVSEAEELLEKRKWNEAAQLLRVQTKKDPNSIVNVVGLSTALTHLGQRDAALELLVQAAKSAKPAVRKHLLERIRVISRTFLTNKTFQIFQDGMNLVLVKKYRSSRERFEKALAEEPDNIEVLLRLGQCFLLEGSLDKATEKFLLAKKLNPFEPEVRLWLGRALFQKGQPNESLPELRFAFDQLSGSELAPVWLAEAYSILNQSNIALRLLDQDVKAWPFHIVSLLTSARLRSQPLHPEASSLWAARKNLQLAMSRLGEYKSPAPVQIKNELSLDLTRPTEELRTETQRLMLQVEGKLNDLKTYH